MVDGRLRWGEGRLHHTSLSARGTSGLNTRFGLSHEANLCKSIEHVRLADGLGQDCIEDGPFLSDVGPVVNGIRRHCDDGSVLVCIVGRLDHSRSIFAVHCERKPRPYQSAARRCEVAPTHRLA